MYKYTKDKKPMYFKMPSSSAPEETIIDTDNKGISIIEFAQKYKGIIVIKVIDKTSWEYDAIYSNVELKLDDNDPVVDYYEISSF
jgi:hypothetical protein